MTPPIHDFDCTFRSADSSDYDALHHLILSCWIETYSPFVTAETMQGFILQDEVGQHLDLFLSTMEVADVNGRVIGVINNSQGFITTLFVARNLRRNRIGSCLLYNAEIAGGSYLEVAEFNYRAISFYEANGWLKVRAFEECVFGTKLRSIAMVKDRTV